MFQILDLCRVWTNFMDLEAWKLTGCIEAFHSLPSCFCGIKCPSQMPLEEWCSGLAALSLVDLRDWRPAGMETSGLTATAWIGGPYRCLMN